MAHTDACKYQVCQLVEKLINNGMSLRAASVETQKESDGIPAKTIQRWWSEIKKETNEECLKNETPQATPQDDNEIQENQDLKSETVSHLEQHGGQRDGAGRKPLKRSLLKLLTQRLLNGTPRQNRPH